MASPTKKTWNIRDHKTAVRTKRRNKASNQRNQRSATLKLLRELKTNLK